MSLCCKTYFIVDFKIQYNLFLNFVIRKYSGIIILISKLASEMPVCKLVHDCEYLKKLHNFLFVQRQLYIFA